LFLFLIEKVQNDPYNALCFIVLLLYCFIALFGLQAGERSKAPTHLSILLDATIL